jgi:type VI protein secretion system component Hcp
MNRRAARIFKILMASALIMTAASASAQYRPGRQKPGTMHLDSAGTATVEPLPPPPPQPAGPQPTPYPNTGTTQQRVVYSADPMEGGQVAAPVASSDPQEGGEVAAHKHIASVKYEDLAAAGDVQVLEVRSVSWAALSSDPEEGGQVARETSKPKVGDINVTKLSDSSSARLAQREPGKVEVPDLEVAVPRVSGGTAKVSVLLKACTTGTHIPNVKIVTRSGGPSYTLRDVTVTACNANGDGETQTCTLNYASLEQ